MNTDATIIPDAMAPEILDNKWIILINIPWSEVDGLALMLVLGDSDIVTLL